jgi:hypothetical protein
MTGFLTYQILFLEKQVLTTQSIIPTAPMLLKIYEQRANFLSSKNIMQFLLEASVLRKTLK